MLKSQTLELRSSEIRSKLNELSGADSLTPEQTAEVGTLTSEYADVETRRRAAIVAESATEVVTEPGQVIDAELRERLDLRSKARLSNFVVAAMRGRQVDGVEAELSDACSARGDIPVELFERDPRDAVVNIVGANGSEQRHYRAGPGGIESRTVTSAPGTVGVNVAPIQPHVFAPSIASYLGIDMPAVPSGTFSQARINAALSADSKAKGGAIDATAATFAVKSATPKRISARLELLAEDIAAAGVSNFESALRQNLTMALSAELDKQMIVGAGAGNDLEGLFHGLTNATADGTTLTFQHGITKMAGLVDGLWATETAHIRQIVGVATYRLAAGVFAGSASNKGERPLADYLRDQSGGFRTNSRMPAVDSTKQQGIAFRSGVSGVRTAVCPHWGRIGISDVYTGAAKAETSVTFHVLLGDVLVIQPGAYAETQYKVS